jgi:DNA polymerase III subunit epsilon
MHRQIVLDTETTGLLTTDNHRLIEIGCLELVNRRFTGRSCHYYLNPLRRVDPGAFAIHGLSDEFLRDKPLFSAIAEELLAFISGAELVIHNAPFDVGFLNHEIKLLGGQLALIEQRCTILDTLVLARNKHPGQSNNLDALCRRYQIDNSQRDLHGALIDAKLLGEVYLAMTGGQDQLFAGEDVVETSAVITASNPDPTIVRQRLELAVIEPTAAELQSHQEFLAMMTKTGRCLWELYTPMSVR